MKIVLIALSCVLALVPPVPPKSAPTFAEQVYRAALAENASEYAILKDDGPTLQDGVLMSVRDGEWIGPGDQIPGGIWLNVTDSVALVTDEDGNTVFDMAANGIIGIEPRRGSETPPIIIQPGSNGKVVICKDGYYACCIESKEGVKATARCRRDTEKDEDCDAGGKGSVSCTITEK